MSWPEESWYIEIGANFSDIVFIFFPFNSKNLYFLGVDICENKTNGVDGADKVKN